MMRSKTKSFQQGATMLLNVKYFATTMYETYLSSNETPILASSPNPAPL